MSNEKATERVRVFPSTQKRIRIKAAKRGKTSMAQVIDEQDRVSTIIGRYPFKPDDPFMKLMKKALKSSP